MMVVCKILTILFMYHYGKNEEICVFIGVNHILSNIDDIFSFQ